MASKPKFVTLTGLDRLRDLDQAQKLSRLYPVEWGVLLARSRAGAKRYPEFADAAEILQRARAAGMMTAVHLCGSAAREFSEGQVRPDIAARIVHAQRVQVNIAAPDDIHATAQTVATTAKQFGVRAILQVRGAFPKKAPVDWLFDQSGGRGQEPMFWPTLTRSSGGFVGIAGGLGPENVGKVLAGLDVEGDFWIDMESRIRDESDNLCFERCADVLRQAYPR